jgi:hypothetical protein
VRADGCSRWRGDLAARALGRSDETPGVALDAHLDGCPACRAELAELQAVVAALELADPERLGVAPGAPRLADRIVARMTDEAAAAAAQHRRRRRRSLLLAGAAAAVVLAVLAVVAVVHPWPSDADAPAHAITMVGVEGVRGTAELTAEPWGTAITLDVAGLTDGEAYWLWLTGDDGRRVVAGSLRGTGGEARAEFASALPADDARRIWLTDDDDRVVLDAGIGRSESGS